MSIRFGGYVCIEQRSCIVYGIIMVYINLCVFLSLLCKILNCYIPAQEMFQQSVFGSEAWQQFKYRNVHYVLYSVGLKCTWQWLALQYRRQVKIKSLINCFDCNVFDQFVDILVSTGDQQYVAFSTLY